MNSLNVIALFVNSSLHISSSTSTFSLSLPHLHLNLEFIFMHTLTDYSIQVVVFQPQRHGLMPHSNAKSFSQRILVSSPQWMDEIRLRLRWRWRWGWRWGWRWEWRWGWGWGFKSPPAQTDQLLMEATGSPYEAFSGWGCSRRLYEEFAKRVCRVSEAISQFALLKRWIFGG